LRNRRLNGLKFRRQVPVGPYVADFLCKEAMLIIEVDGGQHATQVEYDQSRDEFLRANGYQVVRFWNNEVLKNIDGVLEELNRTLTLTLSQRERGLSDGSQREREQYKVPSGGYTIDKITREVGISPSPKVGEGRGEG
jgi:very-short-patch-repair endonuclease